MNFLVYIEFSAENLQFYLWFRDYSQRFNSLPDSEKTLSPPISIAQVGTESPASPRSVKFPRGATKEVDAVLKGTAFASPSATPEGSIKPFDSYSVEDGRDNSFSEYAITLKDSQKTDHEAAAANAFETADVKLQPCK